jgi:membrane-associated phospholipid phosphatase
MQSSLMYLALWALTFLAVRLSGLSPAIPVSFLPFLFLSVFPAAWLAGVVFPSLMQRYFPRTPKPVWCYALGIAGLLLCLHRWWIPIPLLLICLWRFGRDMPRPQWSMLLQIIALVGLGYGIVWNTNYLLASHVDRRFDALLLTIDRKLLGGVPAEGMYPIFSWQPLNLVLEYAYAALFVEVIAVALYLMPRCSARELRQVIHGLFLCYACGVFGFLIFPAIGPCLAFPETLRLAEYSATSRLMLEGMLKEYRALQSGEAMSGFAYFIAVPSLHVAAATYLQCMLPAASTLRRLLLPLNILLSASTVLLGYHYIIDVPTGWLTGYGVAYALKKRAAFQTESGVGGWLVPAESVQSPRS